jgi:outer membrane protein OmpA-like peptidoglycan-associated protein
MVSCAHPESTADYPGQTEIQARQIVATHTLNHCAPLGVTRIDVVINFDTASDALSPEAEAQVDKVAAILNSPSFQGSHVTVAGYTDAVGKSSKNVKLSYNRAMTVLHALVERGVPASLLSAQGFGAANPVATNSTTAGRAANRRVSFVVIGGR